MKSTRMGKRLGVMALLLTVAALAGPFRVEGTFASRRHAGGGADLGNRAERGPGIGASRTLTGLCRQDRPLRRRGGRPRRGQADRKLDRASIALFWA